MYAEKFISVFLKQNPFVQCKEFYQDECREEHMLYQIGTGEEAVLLLARGDERSPFAEEVLGAFLCHIAKSTQQGNALSGICFSRVLKERSFYFVPHAPIQKDEAGFTQLEALCKEKSFRHAVLLYGQGPFVWRPPLRRELWNAQMPLALKILADSIDYPILPFAPPQNSFENYFLEVCHRPVFRFAPPTLHSFAAAEKKKFYLEFEEALLLASIL